MKRNHLVLVGLAAGAVFFLYLKLYPAPGADADRSPETGAASTSGRLQVLQKKLDAAMRTSLEAAKPGTPQENVIAEFERQHAAELVELRSLEAAAESARADPKLRKQIQEQTTAAVAAHRAIRARFRTGELTGLTPELLPSGLQSAPGLLSEPFTVREAPLRPQSQSEPQLSPASGGK